MLEILKAIFFGIVEGITEWLPISSTGHMILLNEFLTLEVSKSFWDMFLVVVQLGAILAVVLLFWAKIWPFGIKGGKGERTDVFLGKVRIKTDIFMMWFKIVAACLPAILFKVLHLDEVCDRYFYNPIGVSIALITFGIIFILVENLNKNRTPIAFMISEITWKMALLIGVFQLLAAAFPGTSRSGATIVGALLIGVSRTAASEFTFILAIPVMFGASLLEILDFGFHLTGLEVAILATGMITAFIVSVVVIKLLLSYIRKHDFKVFGWYRIVLGIIVLLYFFLIK